MEDLLKTKTVSRREIPSERYFSHSFLCKLEVQKLHHEFQIGVGAFNEGFLLSPLIRLLLTLYLTFLSPLAKISLSRHSFLATEAGSDVKSQVRCCLTFVVTCAYYKFNSIAVQLNQIFSNVLRVGYIFCELSSNIFDFIVRKTFCNFQRIYF